MGLSQSWLAVPTMQVAKTLETLSLRRTGEFEEIPESEICGIQLPSGWYLVIGNRCDFATRQPLAMLSRDGDVLELSVEEHVMVSSAALWRNGQEYWSIWHDAQQGIEHLVVRGELPAEFDAIRERLVGEQATDDTVDYIFDIPVEVNAALTGYNYNFYLGDGGEKPYERLESIRRKRLALR